MKILIGLDARKEQAKQDGGQQAGLQPLAIAMDERVVRVGDGRARTEQDQRVEQREVERIDDLDPLGRPLFGRRRARLAWGSALRWWKQRTRCLTLPVWKRRSAFWR